MAAFRVQLARLCVRIVVEQSPQFESRDLVELLLRLCQLSCR